MRVTAAEKQAQIDALEQLKKDGRLTGTHSAYAILKDMFPRGKNPGLKTIGDYMRDKPDLQPHRMPASHAGEKNAVSRGHSLAPCPVERSVRGYVLSCPVFKKFESL